VALPPYGEIGLHCLFVLSRTHAARLDQAAHARHMNPSDFLTSLVADLLDNLPPAAPTPPLPPLGRPRVNGSPKPTFAASPATSSAKNSVAIPKTR